MFFTESYRNMADIGPTTFNTRWGRDTGYKDQGSNTKNPVERQWIRYAPNNLYSATLGDQMVAVHKKMSPHSVTDLMLMVYGRDELVPTFGATNPSASSTLLNWMQAFAGYTSDPEIVSQNGLNGGFFRMPINVDPFTQDDKLGMQNGPMLHPHCISFPKQESPNETYILDYTNSDDNLFEAVDPIALVGPHLIEDLVFTDESPFYSTKATQVFEFVPFDPAASQPGFMPFAYHLRLKNSWESLKDPQMGAALADLEHSLFGAYAYVRDAFTDEGSNYSTAPWSRPPLLQKQKILDTINDSPYFSPESKSGLEKLAVDMRDISPRAMERMKQLRASGEVTATEHALLYPGPAYTWTFYSPGVLNDSDNSALTRRAYLAIQPYIRRTVGAGGISFDVNGDLFRVKKESSDTPLLTESERRIREQFQKGFVERIKNARG
jgi:hypothetical protein